MCYENDYNYYQTIVDGFIHRFEKYINNLFVNIPQPLYQLVLKYYFIPSDDKKWNHL